MGGENKIGGLRKKSTVSLPVLCGCRVLSLSTRALAGRVPLFGWKVMARLSRE